MSQYLYSNNKNQTSPASITLIDILRNRAKNQPSQTAYIFLQNGETESGSITYEELDIQAKAIASKLAKYQGEQALLLYPSGLEFITAFFGCLYAGVVAVPVYPPRRNQKLYRLLSIVKNANAHVALTTKDVLKDIEKRCEEESELAHLKLIATDTIKTNGESFVPKSVTPENLAFLQYTSGSTGNPKGVMVTHGNIIDNMQLIDKAFGHNEKSMGVGWLPLFHDMGLIGHVLQPIYVGFPSVLMPPIAFLQKPIRWLKAISKYKATTSGGANFAYDLCVKKIKPKDLANLDLSSWNLAYSGAEPVQAETLKQFNQKFASYGFNYNAFYPCYGMAETTLFVTGGDKYKKPLIQGIKAEDLEKNRLVESDISAEKTRVFVGCGYSHKNTTVRIVNPESLTLCKKNEIGEIWVSGNSITLGYWDRPKVTQETFNAYIQDTKEGPFLRTGDLGFLKDDELFVTGRLKDLIIIRGRNHYPQDIEATLEKSNHCLRNHCSAAFSIEIDEDKEGLIVVCEVERIYLRKLNVDEIVRDIKIAISTEHELEVYGVVLLKTGSIPKTSSGKIQRRACKQAFLEGTLNIVGEWQKTVSNYSTKNSSDLRENENNLKQGGLKPSLQAGEIESWLINTIAELSEIPPETIDSKESLAVYGLNSVKAVSLASELEEWLGFPVAPTIVYDYPSIHALAQYLGETTPSLESSDFISNPDTANESIAIIGKGCRFPQANNPQEFWSLLSSGKDAITKVPSSRWQSEDTWGGFLDKIDQFDASFFSISPREATNMDPQQRLLLEVSWEALENAGLPAEQLAGSRNGVFIGISSGDYAKLGGNLTNTEAYYGTGNALSISANRLSYFLDWHGPSWAVDTACSSSLVAVHQACQSLLQGECNLALAGGVNLMLTPQITMTFSKAQMMAEDGRCKTFDAEADGYVRSEGCGVVVLKRLSDALADGDNIQAIIKGSAVNQDGLTNGLTAPNGNSQQQVIRLALAKAKVKPNQVSYVETHGTGTPLGDPIELNSLKNVLMEGREANQPCGIGSVKTNIGHTEAAAGIGGLIKVVLSLENGAIPPHLHLNKLNPYISLENTPLNIPTKLNSWLSSEEKKLAGVSAFGFGGTNAHVILEEAPQREFSRGLVTKPLQVFLTEGEYKVLSLSKTQVTHILTLSAKTEKALEDLVVNYENYLKTDESLSIADVCFSANTGRSHFNHRLAIVTSDKQELVNQLAKIHKGKQVNNVFSGKLVNKSKSPKIAFLFTGQGSQYVNMGRQLYETQPLFRQTLEKCDGILQSYLDKSILEVLYPKKDQELNETLINQTTYTQTTLFAIEYALAELWQSWGIKPDVLMGHSVGEYVAGVIAGVFSLEDGLKLIAHRGKLMQKLPAGGAMLAVMSSWEKVNQLIAPYTEKVAIAAINGPESVVISGDIEVIKTLSSTLQSQEIKTKQLQVSHAFHSPLMEPMLADFEAIANEITYNKPSLPIVSNVTGMIADENITTAKYWVNHIRQPVKFYQSMLTLQEKGYEVFLEIGPKPILLGMGKQCLPEEGGMWLPSLRNNQQDWQQILPSLAQLYEQGVKVDWYGFYQDYDCQKVVLPTYPFQRQRYWIDNGVNDFQTVANLSSNYNQDWFYQVEWQSLVNSQPNTTIQASHWLIFADNTMGENIANQLSQQGCEYSLVYRGDGYQKLAQNSYQVNPLNNQDFEELIKDIQENSQLPLQRVIHLWSLDTPMTKDLNITNLKSAQSWQSATILHLLQALIKTKLQPKIWLLTKNCQTVGIKNEKLSIASSTLWGLGKVIALENPNLWGGLIDLDSQTSPSDTENLLKLIANNSLKEDHLALRKSNIYKARLKPTKIDNSPVKLNYSEGSYLITGGLGALGLQLAQWLVKQGAKHLVLLGRSAPNITALQTIESLETSGVEILVFQCDVSKEKELAKVLTECNESIPTLRGIIHGAGILEDGILIQQTWENFEKVMSPKVLGAWNLHHLTQDLPLDFFVMFSSVASLIGSPAQGNYAAANGFLDGLAHYRKGKNLPALSINWGPWADTGMAIDKGLKRKGLNLINQEKGLEILTSLLGNSSAQMGVISVEWDELSQQFPYLREVPYFEEVIKTTSITTNIEKQESVVFEQLLAMSSQERLSYLTSYLTTFIAQILHTDADSISSNDSLIDLGMDSLMVMEAITQLKDDLNLMLYPREFYERPKIGSLVEYLAQEFERSHVKSDNTKITIKDSNQPKIKVNTKIFKKVTHKLNTPILFILSSPRSGSTLLRVMLAGHPEICSPPELHLLPFNTMGERQEELGISHLGEGLQKAFMEIKGINATESQELIDDLVKQNISIQEVYAMLGTLIENKLLVDKSPTYASNKETLEQAENLFTNGKYIHLVRHPYAMIESFARLRMNRLLGSSDDNPYKLAESIWTDSNRNILDFFDNIDEERHHLVRYEDLVTQPATVMKEICEFLGVNFLESLLNPYEGNRMTDGVYDRSMSLGDPNFGKHNQIDAKLANIWQEITLPSPLDSVSSHIAQNLKYELPNEEEILNNSEDLQMSEMMVNIRGLNLCLCSWGPKEGLLVLCLHGILEQGAAWSEVAIGLAQKGYRVIAPDFRGHGKSSHVDKGGSYNLLDFLGDIDAIAENLADKAFTLVGHSLGSVVAAIFASIRPQKVKNLVLVETVLPSDDKDEDTVEQLVNHLDSLADEPKHPVFPDVATAAKRLQQATPALSKSFAMMLAERITEPTEGGVRWRWAPLLRTRAGMALNGISKSKYLGLLQRIKAPITLIYGDKSDFNREEDLSEQQKAMPKAEKIVVSGGHNLHLEVPEILAKIIGKKESRI